MENRQIGLSILIVTWNGDELLENCLKSLRAACGLAPEIVVVDNANLQSTRDVVACFENAKYVAAKENLGFAGGNNLGLSFCTRKYVLLLNNDTIVHEEPFSQMVRYLEDNSQVAVVQGKMRLVRQGDVLDECGSYLTNWGDLYYRYQFAPLNSDVRTGPVFHAKGACLLFRRSVLDALGGVLFYDHFKSYYEDADFCHRVWLAGFEVHFLNTPPIDHLQGATAEKFKRSDTESRALVNQLFSFLTVFGLRSGMAILFRYLLEQFVIFVRFLVSGDMETVRMRGRVFVELWHQRHLLKRIRRNVQAARKVGDSEVFRRVLVKMPFSFHLDRLRGKTIVFGDPRRESVYA